mgnify:CR=1 FL=1
MLMLTPSISRYKGAYCGRYVLRGRGVYVSDVARDYYGAMPRRELLRRHGITVAELRVIVEWYAHAYLGRNRGSKH